MKAWPPWGSREFLRAEHRDASGLAHGRGMLAHDNLEVIFSLPQIKKPTLILVGEEDTPFIAATDYMASKIAAARRLSFRTRVTPLASIIRSISMRQ